MQRVVGGYLAKRIGDELFSSPAQPTAAEPFPDEVTQADREGPDRLDVTDERGRAIGTAYRLPSVAVYVLSDGHGYRQDELEWCLTDPRSEVFVQRQGGRVTGLIYAPARRRTRRRIEGLRADEV